MRKEVEYNERQLSQFEVSAEKLIKFVRQEGRSLPYIVDKPTIEDLYAFLSSRSVVVISVYSFYLST